MKLIIFFKFTYQFCSVKPLKAYIFYKNIVYTCYFYNFKFVLCFYFRYRL